MGNYLIKSFEVDDGSVFCESIPSVTSRLHKETLRGCV